MLSDDVSRAAELRARIEADIRAVHRYVDSAHVNDDGVTLAEVGLGAQVNDDVRHIMADIDDLCRATAPAATGEPTHWLINSEGSEIIAFTRLYTAPPSPSSLPAIPESAVLRKGWTLLVGGGFDSTEELSRRGALSDDPSVEVLLVRADAVRVTPSVEPQREVK